MIRRCPSTIGGELRSAPACCLACAPWPPLRCLDAPWLVEVRPELRHAPSTSRCAYQTSRFAGRRTRASRRGSSRPRRARSRRRSFARYPLSRPATARLAASRLTSHSNGPGSVSSKSLTSKTSRRSGEANAPKLDRCASPHNCTRNPDVGVAARSAAIGSAAPRKNVNGDTSIRPWRTGTSSGTRLFGLPQQQANRIPRPVRRELRVRLQRGRGPGILSPGHPICAGQLRLAGPLTVRTGRPPGTRTLHRHGHPFPLFVPMLGS